MILIVIKMRKVVVRLFVVCGFRMRMMINWGLSCPQSTTRSQLFTSERGVCGGPLAFHYVNLVSHNAVSGLCQIALSPRSQTKGMLSGRNDSAHWVYPRD
jgi:hypothetical protein